MIVPLQVRLIAAGVALAALVGLWLVVDHWRTQAAKVPQLEQRIAKIESAHKRAQEASLGFHQELADVRARARPAPVIRMCVPAVPEAAAEPGSDGSATAAGMVSGGAAKDIGPELDAIARRADEVSAQLRALQGLHENPD